MDIPIILDEETRQTVPNLRHIDDGIVGLGSQQGNDEVARQSELHERVEARRVPLSERLDGTTGVSSTAAVVEESRVRKRSPARRKSKSTAAPADALGHLRPAARRGDMVAEARNRAAQPSTGADDPQTQATRATPVSQSHSRLTPNVPDTTLREIPGFISRSTTSLLDENIPPTIPVSPQNIQLVRTSRKTDGGGPSSYPEAMETSISSDTHKDSHSEVHANSRTEDRGHSVQSPAQSSSSHLPWGALSGSSLPPPPQAPPATIKKASANMRQTPPGEPERRLGSSDTYGRSHVDLPTPPDAVADRVAVTAEPTPHQQSSPPPRIDRNTSHFQRPKQHDTVPSESFASVSLPVRRTSSSQPPHGSDNNVSCADGASVPNTAISWGGYPQPPAKALSPPRDQPSNNELGDRSVSAERPSLSTPHNTPETTDSPSDGTTLKEVPHCGSTTEGRSSTPTLPAAGPTERHGDNLRDPPPQFHSLVVRQSQGDPAAKAEPPPTMGISRGESQTPIDGHTRTKSPPDRKEYSHPSPSQSLSRELGDSPTETTEVIHPAPTKGLSSLPDQLSNKASSDVSLLDPPSNKSGMPASSGGSTTRKEVSDSSSSMQARTLEPPLSVTEAHSAQLHGLQTPPSSSVVCRGQGDPVPPLSKPSGPSGRLRDDAGSLPHSAPTPPVSPIMDMAILDTSASKMQSRSRVPNRPLRRPSSSPPSSLTGSLPGPFSDISPYGLSGGRSGTPSGTPYYAHVEPPSENGCCSSCILM